MYGGVTGKIRENLPMSIKTDQGVVTVAEAAVGRAGALSKTAVAEAGCAVSAVAVAV